MFTTLTILQARCKFCQFHRLEVGNFFFLKSHLWCLSRIFKPYMQEVDYCQLNRFIHVYMYMYDVYLQYWQAHLFQFHMSYTCTCSFSDMILNFLHSAAKIQNFANLEDLHKLAVSHFHNLYGVYLKYCNCFF